MSDPPVPGLLAGRTVLITGGSMGIGLACAEAALAAGARVAIAARGERQLDAAQARLAAQGSAGRVMARRCDIAVDRDVAELMDAVVARFGRLDGVVHAAAVIGPIGSVLEIEPDAWLETVRSNLYGAFLVLRHAAAHMRRTGGGRIVLLSGGGATAAFPNYSPYACSKAGVVRLVETAAVELAAHDIAVNALAPGFVATRMHEATLAAGVRAGAAYLERTRADLAAGGVPASLAGDAAVFLLSARSAGISGRLFAAPWDDAAEWSRRAAEIAGSDLFTLRRIVPRDRGAAWQ
jgi:NAD(P)-dependent dehydrogenase (short-subunit alcohol dehydrogenase family)